MAHAYIRIHPPYGSRFIQHTNGDFDFIFETKEKPAALEFARSLLTQVELVTSPEEIEAVKAESSGTKP